MNTLIPWLSNIIVIDVDISPGLNFLDKSLLKLTFFFVSCWIEGAERIAMASAKCMIIAVFVLLVANWAPIVFSDGDFCNTYGPDTSNPVYPQGSGTNSHDLQYTKAVSEYYWTQLIQISVYYTSKIPIFVLVSKHAPLFEGTAVINSEFTQLSLSDYLGKYVVFFFYPLDL